MASRLSGPPRLAGKSGSDGSPCLSCSQARSTATVGAVNGVTRSLRPLVRHEALCRIPRAAGREWR